MICGSRGPALPTLVNREKSTGKTRVLQESQVTSEAFPETGVGNSPPVFP